MGFSAVKSSSKVYIKSVTLFFSKSFILQLARSRDSYSYERTVYPNCSAPLFFFVLEGFIFLKQC